jgi:uncharacterized protein
MLSLLLRINCLRAAAEFSAAAFSILLIGCSPNQHDEALTQGVSISIQAGDSWFDETDIVIKNLRTNVVVTLARNTVSGARLCSWAEFAADDRGSVSTLSSFAIGGTYLGTDDSGLFWSGGDCQAVPARLGKTVRQEADRWPSKELTDFKVWVDTGHGIVSKEFSVRAWPGAETYQSKQLPEATPNVGISIYEAANRRTDRVAVLLGGSDGSPNDLFAAYLASLGIDSVSLAYFGQAQTPPCLSEIELRDVDHAFDALQKYWKSERRFVVVGVSRGAEAAVQLAAIRSIDGLILVAPRSNFGPSVTSDACRPSEAPAWVLDEEPIASVPRTFKVQLPQETSPLAPVDTLSALELLLDQDRDLELRTRVPIGSVTEDVLVIVGEFDRVSGLPAAQRLIARHRLASACVSRLRILEGASHAVFGPHLVAPAAAETTVPILDRTQLAQRARDAKARKEIWADIESFLIDRTDCQ